MLETLQTLAKQIAALRQFGEQSDNPALADLTEELARSLTQTVDEMAAEEGALDGEMPWLDTFRNPPTNR